MALNPLRHGALSHFIPGLFRRATIPYTWSKEAWGRPALGIRGDCRGGKDGLFLTFGRTFYRAEAARQRPISPSAMIGEGKVLRKNVGRGLARATPTLNLLFVAVKFAPILLLSPSESAIYQPGSACFAGVLSCRDNSTSRSGEVLYISGYASILSTLRFFEG